jgi:hypothetical protein
MNFPPYIRGLIDIFSSGKRAAMALFAIGITIIVISLAISFASHYDNPDYEGNYVTVGAVTYVGAFFFVPAILALIGDLTASATREQKQQVERRARVRSAEEKLENAVKGDASPSAAGIEGDQMVGTPADALDLSVLWEVTNARLDDYHGIATGQARKSFTTAQCAIAAGFIILIGFAALSFRTHSTAASITIAALGGVAAGLAGYIGRTFIRSQETAARYLRAYFDQPLAFSRYLAAERLLSSQSDARTEERDAILRIIISAMVEGSDANSESSSNGREEFVDMLRGLLRTPNV